MRIARLPAGFVIPAQPIKASKPPFGPNWVHEIKHDGYRLIVRRDGPTVWPASIQSVGASLDDEHGGLYGLGAEPV